MTGVVCSLTGRRKSHTQDVYLFIGGVRGVQGLKDELNTEKQPETSSSTGECIDLSLFHNHD